jgi:hypothetical protein
MSQVEKHEQSGEESEAKMNKLRNDIIAEIERDHVEQIQIHGIVRKGHEWNFINTTMIYIQLWNS